MTAQPELVLRLAQGYDLERRGSPEIGPERLREIQIVRDTQSARSGSPSTRALGPNVRSAQKGVFRKEGEYWTVGYSGKAFRLKDTKGLGYLAHLLRHPATEFHVLHLAGGIGGEGGGETNESP